MNLISERLDVDDYDEAVELFYQRKWTDGLPSPDALIDEAAAAARVAVVGIGL